MTVTAYELLASAQKASGYSDCEADERGVISRAYYAIYDDGLLFHKSLASPGALKPDSKGGLHQNLHERLKNPTINKKTSAAATSIKVGTLMALLHALRTKADYYRDRELGKTDAADSISFAKAILDTLYPTQPPIGKINSVPENEKAQSSSAHPILPSDRPTLKRIK